MNGGQRGWKEIKEGRKPKRLASSVEDGGENEMSVVIERRKGVFYAIPQRRRKERC